MSQQLTQEESDIACDNMSRLYANVAGILMKCSFCPFMGMGEKIMDEHFTAKHRNKPSQRKFDVVHQSHQPEPGKLTCPHCKYSVMRIETMQKHIHEKHREAGPEKMKQESCHMIQEINLDDQQTADSQILQTIVPEESQILDLSRKSTKVEEAKKDDPNVGAVVRTCAFCNFTTSTAYQLLFHVSLNHKNRQLCPTTSQQQQQLPQIPVQIENDAKIVPQVNKSENNLFEIGSNVDQEKIDSDQEKGHLRDRHLAEGQLEDDTLEDNLHKKVQFKNAQLNDGQFENGQQEAGQSGNGQLIVGQSETIQIEDNSKMENTYLKDGHLEKGQLQIGQLENGQLEKGQKEERKAYDEKLKSGFQNVDENSKSETEAKKHVETLNLQTLQKASQSENKEEITQTKIIKRPYNFKESIAKLSDFVLCGNLSSFKGKDPGKNNSIVKMTIPCRPLGSKNNKYKPKDEFEDDPTANEQYTSAIEHANNKMDLHKEVPVCKIQPKVEMLLQTQEKEDKSSGFENFMTIPDNVVKKLTRPTRSIGSKKPSLDQQVIDSKANESVAQQENADSVYKEFPKTSFTGSNKKYLDQQVNPNSEVKELPISTSSSKSRKRTSDHQLNPDPDSKEFPRSKISFGSIEKSLNQDFNSDPKSQNEEKSLPPKQEGPIKEKRVIIKIKVVDKAKTKRNQKEVKSSSSKLSTTNNLDSIKRKSILMTSQKSETNKTGQNVTKCHRGQRIVDKVVAVARISGSVKYLVKWKDSKFPDLLSNDEVTLLCPDLVINFYERRISWNLEFTELTINLFKTK